MPDRRAIILLYVTVKLGMCLTQKVIIKLLKDRVKRCKEVRFLDARTVEIR